MTAQRANMNPNKTPVTFSAIAPDWMIGLGEAVGEVVAIVLLVLVVQGLGGATYDEVMGGATLDEVVGGATFDEVVGGATYDEVVGGATNEEVVVGGGGGFGTTLVVVRGPGGFGLGFGLGFVLKLTRFNRASLYGANPRHSLTLTTLYAEFATSDAEASI